MLAQRIRPPARVVAAAMLATSTMLSSPLLSAPVHADEAGVRLGPVETVCVVVPEAAPGDVALINVTVVDPSAPGFVTAHGASSNPLEVSSVNFDRGDIVANLTATVITDDGRACFTSSLSASTHLAADLVGIVAGDHFTATPDGGERLLDTRRQLDVTSGAKVAPDASVCIDVDPPGDGAGVAVVNATITEPDAAGFVTVRGASADAPTTSTHNFAAGQTVANLTVTALEPDQQICATMSPWSATHVIFDLVGWLDGDVFEAPASGAARVLDTRLADAPGGGAPIAPSATTCTPLIVQGVTPSSGDLAIANTAITEPDGIGFATVHGATAGPVSTHNFTNDQTVANLTAFSLADDAALCVTASPWSRIHAVADVSGVIDEAAVVAISGGARRLLDTREQEVLPGRQGDPRLAFFECDALLQRFQMQRLAALSVYDDDTEVPAIEPTFFDAQRRNQFVTGDEGADFVSDDRYVYRSHSPVNALQLQVIDVVTEVRIATVELPGVELFSQRPKMVLVGDRLVVTTGSIGPDGWPMTVVSTFDVADPGSPQLVGRFGLDGDRSAMRAASDGVRFVTRTLPTVGRNWATGTSTVAELRNEVQGSTIDDWLPEVYDVAADGTTSNARPALDCDDVGVSNLHTEAAITWVADDDLVDGVGPDDTIGVATGPDNTTVMTDATSVFVTAPSHVPEQLVFEDFEVEVATGVHHFAIGSSATRYGGSTDVPGNMVERFPIVELDGVLRIATSSPWWDGNSSTTGSLAVYALRRHGSVFERLSAGHIDDSPVFDVSHTADATYVAAGHAPDWLIDFRDPTRITVGVAAIDGASAAQATPRFLEIAPQVLIGVGAFFSDDASFEAGEIALLDASDPTALQQIDVSFVGLPRPGGFFFDQPSGTFALTTRMSEFGPIHTDVLRVSDGSIDYVDSLPDCVPELMSVVGDALVCVTDDLTTIVDLETLEERVQLDPSA